MGNIELSIKESKLKETIKTFTTTLGICLVPSLFISMSLGGIYYSIKYFLETYLIYWSLFKQSIVCFVDSIPQFFIIFGALYIILVVFTFFSTIYTKKHLKDMGDRN